MLHPDLSTAEISALHAQITTPDDQITALADGDALRILDWIEIEGTPLDQVPALVALAVRRRPLDSIPGMGQN